MARLARQLPPAKYVVSTGTKSSARRIAPRVNVKAKQNTTMENFMMGSLNTIAMTRGVSWELASCTATSSAEDTKTMNVNIDEAMVPSTAWAVPGSRSDLQPRV